MSTVVPCDDCGAQAGQDCWPGCPTDMIQRDINGEKGNDMSETENKQETTEDFFNGLLTALERIAIEGCVASVQRDMARYGGDGFRIWKDEDVEIGAVMSIARGQVEGNLGTLDTDETIAAQRATMTPERVRLGENVSNWVEGFLVGHRYHRIGTEARDQRAAEEQEEADKD